jgi:beta-glucosidase
MGPERKARVFVVAVLAIACNSVVQSKAAAGTPSEQTERKVDTLLRQMTVEEKVGQLTQSFHFVTSKAVDDRVIAGAIGSFDHEFDVAEINRLQHLAVDQSRLHIPLIFEADVIHGYRVILPVPLGMAASWDMNMIEQVQRRAAFEARTAGQQWNAGPMLDIVHDPRWGRIVEGAGEDPYLGAKVAVAQVKGFQGLKSIDAPHMVTALKHFAGYGFSDGGRDHDAVYLSESQLRNVVLKPFKAAIDAGAGTIMDAYIDLNDVPASGNHWLLSELLRDEWKFKGVVVSDNNAVADLLPHGFAKDKEDAARRALHAGVDVSMSNSGLDYEPLLAAAKDGTLKVAELDRSVRRVLRLKFDLGLFDHPYADAKEMDEATFQEHLQAARAAAARCAVLLRNENGLLPLTAGKYPKAALIGQLADSRQNTIGPWVDGWDIDRVVTIRKALEQSGRFKQVEYAQGVQLGRLFPSPFDRKLKEKQQTPWTQEQSDREFQHALDVAKESDVVITVMGELQNMSGEAASRASLDLPGRQEELLKALALLGKPIILVLFNGRPLTIPWEAEHIPGILEMWFPGSEGGDALVDLLFGDANPGGKLPVTWPRNANQIPMYYYQNLTQDPQNEAKRYWDVAGQPLFAFGFGLSYTKFSFSSAKALTASVKLGQPVSIEAEVSNTGEMAGDVVAQLYIHQRFGSTSRPSRELKGFERISLQPHAKKTISFVIPPEDLAYWSTTKHGWTQDVSTFDFWVGEDSTASSNGSFSVTP